MVFPSNNMSFNSIAATGPAGAGGNIAPMGGTNYPIDFSIAGIVPSALAGMPQTVAPTMAPTMGAPASVSPMFMGDLPMMAAPPPPFYPPVMPMRVNPMSRMPSFFPLRAMMPYGPVIQPNQSSGSNSAQVMTLFVKFLTGILMGLMMGRLQSSRQQSPLNTLERDVVALRPDNDVLPQLTPAVGNGQGNANDNGNEIGNNPNNDDAE